MLSNAVRMALCIECLPAVQEVRGSIPDCDAFIAPVLESGFYAEDVDGPGQAPTLYCNENILYRNLKSANSPDYAQKPQRTCMFINSASEHF